MEPMERTNDTNHQAPIAPQPVKVKRKRPIGWILLSLLLLIGAGVLAYFLYMSTIDATKADEQLTASKAKVADLEERLTEAGKTDEAAADTDEETTDQQQIIDVASAYARAEKGAENAKVNVNVAKLEGDFAFVNVNVAGAIAGYSCVLKKSDDMWLRLYCGQNESEETQRLDTLYGVPKSITQS